MSQSKQISVQVAFVAPEGVKRLRVELPQGSVVGDAVRLAGRLAGGVEFGPGAVAVFGRRRPLDEPLNEGDRIELLGPLRADPKLARQRRVASSRSKQARDRWRGSR